MSIDGLTPTVRAAGRKTLALLCGLDAAVLALGALSSRAGLVEVAAPIPLFSWLRAHESAQLALLLGTLVGLWQFGWRASLLGGAAAAVLDGLLYETHTAAFGRIEAEFLIPRATLVGWLIGAVLLRAAVSREGSRRPAVADLGGWHGAVAIFAATYVAAGLSKLLRSGLGWADPRTIDYILLANMPADTGLRATLDQALLRQPTLARGLAGYTLVVELGALLVLCGPRGRQLACAGIASFHLGLMALTGLLAPGSVILAALFGVPWTTLRPAADGDPEAIPALDRRRSQWAIGAALLVALALGALAWYTPLRQHFALSPEARLRPWQPEVAPRPPP